MPPLTSIPRPLAQADLSRVRIVLADVDGTLTRHDRLRSSTTAALEQLSAAGLQIGLVTGRPSGWAEAWARTLPVAGVIAENGGVTYRWTRRGLVKDYAEPPALRARNRRRLWREVRRILREFPQARLSMDSASTEVDLAIDHNEQARLSAEATQAIQRALAARGVRAVRSSVHINCWLGPFDKRTAVERFLWQAFRIRKRAPERVVYVGDSFNDAPMFAAYPLSVGVANVGRVLHEIECPPAFITRAEEGEGFEELARALIRARKGVTR